VVSTKLKGVCDEGTFLYYPKCICTFKNHQIKISFFIRGAGVPVVRNRVLCLYFSTQLTDSKLPDFDIRARKQLYYDHFFNNYDSIYVRAERQDEVKSLFSADILFALNKLFLKNCDLHFMAVANSLTLSIPSTTKTDDIEELYLFFTGFIDHIA
jgi:hypothetical protein